MGKVTFLWHLHQPRYRTADGVAHAPWVLLHAAGEYLTLAHALHHTGVAGQVLNLTPVFLEQLLAYAENRVRDPLLEALSFPASELTAQGVRELLRWAFLLHPRQLARLPRLFALQEKLRGCHEDEMASRLSVAEVTDLQVLVILAHAAPNARWEEVVAALMAKGAGFSQADREALVSWLRGCPAKLLQLYRSLAGDGVEVATSPYAHPLLPLLLDTQVAAASVPPPPGGFPAFSAPEDADAQIEAALSFMSQLGFHVRGFWPPEGALSEEAVELYGRHQAAWLATDEGLLAASLGQPLSSEMGVALELFSPWQLRGCGPAIFFRHRQLSDYIGFRAQEMPEEQAADHVLQALQTHGHKLPGEGGLLVALDGENPWTSYPEGGARFLVRLFQGLATLGRYRLVTLSQRAHEEKPRPLPRLHPGSWIGASFATWIGHEEKNKAWQLLARCRQAGAHGGGEFWLVAQGSDWWWWFGDDNPTLLAPLYDRLFRQHLADALSAAGREPLPELAVPVRRGETRVTIPLSRQWPAPVLDGRSTSYFEWVVAQWLESSGWRLALRADGEQLWLRLDPPAGAPAVLPVAVTVGSERHMVRYVLPADCPESAAAGKILEAALPLPAGNSLLVVEAPGVRFPPWGAYCLQLLEVDEP